MIYAKLLLLLLLAVPVFAASTINNTGGAYIMGNVSVGTLGSNARLHVNGSILETPGRPREIGSVYNDILAFGSGITVSGKYAYTTTYNWDTFAIFDVSNPASPRFISNLTDEERLNAISSIQISGKYAYVTSILNESVVIIDVSNVSSPSIAGYISHPSLGLGYSMYVSGKYAYVASDSSQLIVLDISNPTAPVIAGNLSGLFGPEEITIHGKRAYVTTQFAQGLYIIDISNATLPVVVGEYLNVSLEGMGGLAAAGRYVYFTDTSNSINNYTFFVLDVSDITAPLVVGTIVDPSFNGSASIQLAGKYAYTWSAVSKIMNIIDVTNATSPVVVAQYVTNYNDWSGFYISGNYAYFHDDDTLRVVDLGGIDSPVASIGAIETGSLSVTENANIANDLHVGSGLNVGSGGIYSQGPVAILSGIARSAFEIISSAGTSLFYISSRGFVGVNTSTPTSLLHVSGDTNVTTTLYSGGCVGCTVADRLPDDVTEVNSLMTNITNMNFTAGFNQTWRFAFYLGLNASSKSANMDFAVAAPSQSSCVYTATGGPTNAVDKSWQSGCSKLAFFNSPAVVPTGVIIHGTVVTGNVTGLVTLSFRMNSAGEETVTVLRGSYFKATRIR